MMNYKQVTVLLVCSFLSLLAQVWAQDSTLVQEPHLHTKHVQETGQYRKPGAAVWLLGEQIREAYVGEQGQLQYQIQTKAATGVVRVTVSVKGSSAVIDIAAASYEFDLSQGPAKLIFDYDAQALGTSYLNFYIEYQGSARAFVRAVEVVDEMALQTRQLKSLTTKSETGKLRYHDMPAQETVSPSSADKTQ
ncbi:hypothetical protein [Agaribacterium sp. ZY112]|uniref:hypothetical protein n=1 Tax=Agaribacterium sp. ZY112 TaxID=3233574 RepID=UPI003525AF69